MAKFTDIIERTEFLRNHLGLNKSRFSAQIDMKPQTYNNFLGAQSTKPNIELVYGIIQQYNVNPMWLLKGEGEMFRESSGSTLAPILSTPRDVEKLKQKIKESRRHIGNVENRVRNKLPEHVPAIHHSIEILKEYFRVDPLYTMHAIKAMLTEFDERMENK